MYRKHLLPLCLLTVAAGCVEYTLEEETEIKDPLDGQPVCIEVDPGQVVFDQLEVAVDEPQTAVVRVINNCEGDLEIRRLELEDHADTFTVGQVSSVLVRGGSETDFTVTFDPQTAANYETRVLIENNSDDTPVASVKLTGEGIAPVIEVSPDSYDFGSPYIGCQLSQPYTIANAGNADLLVEDFELFTASNDFDFDPNKGSNGELPLLVSPGNEVEVYVKYLPLDEFVDSAYLTVLSNDPFTPEVVVQSEGTGNKYGDNTDIFEQPLKSATDVLFTLDWSCSMYDDNANVAANFETFVSTVTSLEADYHISVGVADSGCAVGSDPYIDKTFSKSDASSTFNTLAAIDTGGPSPYGANTERGYMLAEAFLAATDTGDCNDGFLRDNAFLSLVHVSDEPEQSVNSWAYYVSLFQSLKDDPDDVKINAIAGDYPGGCGSASAGTGYYEGTVATGGLFLSICATDWASHLEDLAAESVSVNDSFELTRRPVPQTLEVEVDGILQSTGWNYDAVTNYVVFETDYIPAGGATVEIFYQLMPDCES